MPDVPILSPPEIFGLKVSSISASMGWGGQGGSCQLNLIDEGVPPDLPPNGTACGFIFNKFKFGGHLQRWTYKESLSGRFYDVTLESPAKLLDGVQVILSDFETGYREDGSKNVLTTQVRNVWNPFAEWEAYGYVDEDGDFIDLGGTFGHSEVNSAGIPIYTLFPKLTLLGIGEATFGSKIMFGESEYTIDFSELFDVVTARAPYYRVKGPVQSLNGIMGDLAEVAQVDYFVQCIASNNGAIADPQLKVRIADRGTVASGVIDSYVDEFKGTGVVISTNSGEELQDVATGKVLIGGPASRYYEAPVFHGFTARSVWGSAGGVHLLSSSPPIVEYNNLNTTLLVSVYQFQPFYIATMFELRMALGGQQTWETFKMFQMIAGVEPNGYVIGTGPFFGTVGTNARTLYLLAAQQGPPPIHVGNLGGLPARDAIDMALTNAKSACAYNEEAMKLQKDIFDAVHNVASNFYGQVFMVPLPFEPGGIDNNLRFLQEDIQYEASWEISESAWPETTTIPDWNFYDGDGKLKAASKYPFLISIDYSPLGEHWALTDDTVVQIATTKGGPDKDLFWVSDRGQPLAIVRSGAQLRHYDGITTYNFGLTVLAAHFFKDVSGQPLYIPPAYYSGPGKQSIQISIPPAVVAPNSIGIPQESKRYTWGPWWSEPIGNGKAEVEVDSSMRPETFGSVFLMDQVGWGSVFSGLAQIEAIESGSVELALAPDFNIGDRFNSSGPYVTGMDISVGVDGYKTNYKFSTWTPNFGKLAKYNADRLSRINKGGIALAKSNREKRHKRPFPVLTPVLPPPHPFHMGMEVAIGNFARMFN